MTDEHDTLRECAQELERAAARLRSGDADGEEAAALVERCAELAGRVAASLDREARAVAQLPLDERPEQERLL